MDNVRELLGLLKQPFANQDLAEVLARLKRESPARFTVQVDPGEGSRDKACAILMDRYTFAGETHTLEFPPNWLRNPSADTEWHILLHKFYYGPGLGEAFRQTQDRRYLDKWLALTRSWIEQTPAGFIAADVTGRRIQNWIYSYSYFADHLPESLHASFLVSLHAQVQWLISNLHAARNHRTLELHAIFLAAIAFPEFERAAHWREYSAREIAANMRTDLQADGVHCEQSADYHHLVLKNYLGVRQLAASNALTWPADLDALLLRALEFSMHIHRPDGLVPALSDGDVRDHRNLLRQGYELFGRQDMLYAATAGKAGHPPAQCSRSFTTSGYTVMRSGWGEGERAFEDEHYLVFDCGPLGAGNHGHLDLLSFEAYAYGHPLVVDPGRYTDHEDANENWRARFRGTDYHNTVVVDSMNQTHYAPGAPRYKIKGPEPGHELRRVLLQDGFSYVHGIARSHVYDAVHERRIAFVNAEYWIVLDTLSACTEHRYDQVFHLSPKAWGHTCVARETAGSVQVTSPHLLMVHLASEGSTASAGRGYVSQSYGVKRPAPVVRFSKRARDAEFATLLFPFREVAPVVRLHRGPGNVITVEVAREGRVYADRCLLEDASPQVRREAAIEDAYV
jgi:Heparinase II/III N-terminus/Heparinase II/III-like protein